jgi:hypothetical protein
VYYRLGSSANIPACWQHISEPFCACSNPSFLLLLWFWHTGLELKVALPLRHSHCDASKIIHDTSSVAVASPLCIDFGVCCLAACHQSKRLASSLKRFDVVKDYFPLSLFHGLTEILFLLCVFRLQDKVLRYLRAWGRPCWASFAWPKRGVATDASVERGGIHAQKLRYAQFLISLSTVVLAVGIIYISLYQKNDVNICLSLMDYS